MKVREAEELKEGMLIGSGRRDKINAVFMISAIFKKKKSDLTCYELTRISPTDNSELYKKDLKPSLLERRQVAILTKVELLTPRLRKINDE
jgi:hypothetical protein